MPQRHLWRRPECNQEAQINRMTDMLVEHRCLEANRHGLLAFPVESDLTQPKEVEMTDHKRATQDRQPPDPVERYQSRVTCGVLYVPHGFGHGPPLPIEQVQAKTSHQHIRAALNRLGNDSRPQVLKPLPRHHAVLDGEKPQQQSVDDEGRNRKSSFIGINGSGNKHVADKTYRVQECAKEDEVRDQPVEKRCDSGHWFVLLPRVISPSQNSDRVIFSKL